MDFITKNDSLIEQMKISSAIKSRKIYIWEEIDRDSIFKANYWLDRIVSIDEKENIQMSKRFPIEILISSYGGVIYDGLALISNIERCKKLGYEIITTVQGTAMSMGFLISVTGSKRYAYAHARLMTHQPLSWTEGKLEEIQRDTKETEYLWNKSKDIIMKYTKITEKQLDDYKERCRDWYMSSEEALEFGVIDEIL